MHDPALHRWPTPQAGPPPQLHAPPEQLSAFSVSQDEHSAPAAPHAVAVRVVHAPFRQHPVAQVVALQPWHWWPAHCCGDGQVWHATPPDPHADATSPAWQAPPAQHPAAQLAAVHTQVPP